MVVYVPHIISSNIEQQEMKALEENIEQSLLREEQAIKEEEAVKLSGASDDIVALQKALRETKAKYEVCRLTLLRLIVFS